QIIFGQKGSATLNLRKLWTRCPRSRFRNNASVRGAVIILDLDLVMRLPKIITLLSAVVFAVSLTQNCYNIEVHNPKASSPGLYLLLIGPIGVFHGIFEWLANP